MKKLALVSAVACALTAGAAQAGNMSDPVLEQDLIATEATASSVSGTTFVALLALSIILPILD